MRYIIYYITCSMYFTATADIYKCKVGEKISYQQFPCEGKIPIKQNVIQQRENKYKYLPIRDAVKSESCKEAAANKWLLDFTMKHGKPTQKQRMESIRQVIIFTEAIRKYCGDNKINIEILQAASRGVKPKWIESEFNALITQLQ